MYHLRQGNLDQTRKTFGQALGRCPRPSLFKAYTDFEMQLFELDRCRTIFERQLTIYPKLASSWVSYAEFETALGEIERARSIYSLGCQ